MRSSNFIVQQNIHRAAHKQQGAVLATTLMLLVMITLMGMHSMRQGMFQAQMDGAQISYDACFHAAESGLTAVQRLYQQGANPAIAGAAVSTIKDVTNFLNIASQANSTDENGVQRFCLTNGGLVAVDDFGDTACTELSEFASLYVRTLTRGADNDNFYEFSQRPMFGNGLNKGGACLGMVYTESTCSIEGQDFTVTNVQAWEFVLAQCEDT